MQLNVFAALIYEEVIFFPEMSTQLKRKIEFATGIRTHRKNEKKNEDKKAKMV